MKIKAVRFKVILLWFFAILVMAAHPVETQESFKEIEETEEVKLYWQDGKHVKQKPKAKVEKTNKRQQVELYLKGSYSSDTTVLPKYILYCNLIYYG